jgi:hypothetical protein
MPELTVSWLVQCGTPRSTALFPRSVGTHQAIRAFSRCAGGGSMVEAAEMTRPLAPLLSLRAGVFPRWEGCRLPQYAPVAPSPSPSQRLCDRAPSMLFLSCRLMRPHPNPNTESLARLQLNVFPKVESSGLALHCTTTADLCLLCLRVVRWTLCLSTTATTSSSACGSRKRCANH